MSETQENIVEGNLVDLFKVRYSAFAASSNARALPDARDGMKPVHRRILYGARSDSPSSRKHVKSAKLVGSVLGNFHPHGDKSVYDAMTRMTRHFSNNVSLLNGSGNFGSIDGSGSAAMRYTEIKVDPISDWLVLDGVDGGAVPHQPNYDESTTEPELLPVRLPMLLLNGVPAGSIGVGYTSTIPPHNAIELAKACKIVIKAMSEGRSATVDEVLQVMPGPDLPTGGIIGGYNDIREVYKTGGGSFLYRSNLEIDYEKNVIIAHSIPYGMNTEQVTSSIAEAARGRFDPKKKTRTDPTIPEIREVRDETTSDRKTDRAIIRIVIEVKRGENPDIVATKLYQHTPLQSSFAVNMHAQDETGKPVRLTLIDAIERWAVFRSDCIRRLTAANLERLREREHVLHGLTLALQNIDAVVKIIRESQNDEVAIEQLRAQIGSTSRQSAAILDMRLRRLTGLRQTELETEINDLSVEIGEHLDLLSQDGAVVQRMLNELDEIPRRIPGARCTQIQEIGKNFDPRALVEPEACLISITGRGYLKRQSEAEFNVQLRGGKGRKTKMKPDDQLLSAISCHSHDRLFAITDKGSLVRMEAHEVPTTTTGRHAANLGFDEEELVKSVISSPWPIPENYEVVTAKSDGTVKRVTLTSMNPRIGNRLNFFQGVSEGEVVGGILLPDGESDIFLASANGLGARFEPSEVRLTRRESGGVRGMRLREGDSLVAIGRISDPEELILVVTSDGIGKRVKSEEFPAQNRGIMGRILVRLREGASVVKALVVRDQDSVVIMTAQGQTVRVLVSDIKELGRTAQGVKLVTLNEGDYVVSAALLPYSPEEESAE